MAKLLTFHEAQSRFDSLITTDITTAEAIQEAVDRIYELGRYPGTTEEIELLESMFVEEDDEWILEVDDTQYNGAIGFRNDHGGWSIRDQEVLYKEGVNAGDNCFIDLERDPTEGSTTRRYRAPRGFNPTSGGPYYALMKLEPPSLAGDDLVPIESIGGLKAAIQAICYEYVGDEERAQFYWDRFELRIQRSIRQVDGPKKRYIGVDSSLRRKPKQFM